MIGPNGEKRPNDANALRVATGEAEEVYVDVSKRPGGRSAGELARRR